MVPAMYVLLTALPLNANGKVDRKKLPAPHEDDRQREAYSGPRTEVERMLCAIWQEILHLERVGIHDNFFALGGDSILSIRIVARAQANGLSLSVKDVFEWQTIAQLAQGVALNLSSGQPQIEV
jgi:aryl carrier-like protein